MMQRLFDILIPNTISKNDVNYTYAKNLIYSCIIAFLAAPIYVILYFKLDFPRAGIAVAIADVIMMSSLLVLHYLRSIQLANIIYLSSMSILLFWLTYNLSGMYAATAYWIILPSLIAMFIGGTRAGFMWSAFSIIATTIIYIMSISHYKFPISPVSDPILLQYIGICGFNLVIIFLIYFYESEKQSKLEKLRYIAYHDTLTSLPNRTAYDEILQKSLEKSKNQNMKLAILYIDIDNFKRINSIFGNTIGDLLLIEISQRLKRNIMHTDTMARVSGDQFKIIIENVKNEDEVNEVANILLMTLKIPYHIYKNEIMITASIGIVSYPRNEMKSESIDRYLAIALSKAKKLNGDNYQFYTEKMAAEEELQVEIEKHLPNAIINDELDINFQFQFNTKNHDKITGIEALMRWHNNHIGSEITSDTFIPIAERIGIINQLGEWVMMEACKQYVKWLNEDLLTKDIRLAVNISAHQLYDKSFINMINKIIKSTGIPPECLELELTETAIITDQQNAITVLQQLNELGIQTVIDDFGAGYTTLSYLTLLPIKGIKIDKSFLENIYKTSDNSIIIASVIDLAHKINLKVVVEGVESAEQLNYLKNIDCDFVQGFFLSRPLDAAATYKILLFHKK